jgi:hypothetical protein
MDLFQFVSFDTLGKLLSTVLAIAGAWWAYEKWKKRDEHFPRINFEVSVNFLGVKDHQVVCELIAILENKGVVPLKIKDFSFRLLGLGEHDPILIGGEEIRKQIRFPRRLSEGVFVPESWEYSFVYPGIKTEYNFITSIPEDTSYVRIQGDFEYLEVEGSHHAAKALKVPQFD